MREALLTFSILILVISNSSGTNNSPQLRFSKNDLQFDRLAPHWDEAIPLGNGMLGALIWQNGKKLRFSLDRADLWDLRPMENLNTPEWKYTWVYQQWKNNTYEKVQDNFDKPYSKNPAPSKIPAGALEFDISGIGKISSVRLSLNDASCVVTWETGVRLIVFVHAVDPVGWYRFEGVNQRIHPELVPPPYSDRDDSGDASPVTGQDLRRLGYDSGTVETAEKSKTYIQKGWGGFNYQINTVWEENEKTLTGCWSISSHYPDCKKQENATAIVHRAFSTGFEKNLASHIGWWKHFWAQSSINIPDEVLMKQWHLEMYKFASAARKGAPPISLQAVWTADNGKLPPWKGDFHNDLNTQLSYWPAYSSNHLDLEQGFIDWLWKNKPAFERYTRQYFETNGLNVPGVTTLTGEPMGGGIQYSFGPTVSAWLAHHFYLHWRYTMDEIFLEKRAYPWLKAVATYLDELSVTDTRTGKRKIPISSSPEIFKNSRKAWFENMTNFDLALIRWTFEKAIELAKELNKENEILKWRRILNEWDDYSIDKNNGFNFAPGFPYNESHRHFSHLMAFHPLGLIDWSNGESSQTIIKNTLSTLEKYGTDWWTGYSFAWQGNLYARALDGEKAAAALRTFAECFCLPNSFHANGDQSNTGKSKYTYRPFTLEGNFAFAAGVQEMLLQSHTGVIKIFPAIPDTWQNVSFNQLRTEGAFLISAEKKDGQVFWMEIYSEKGGELKLANPFEKREVKITGTDRFNFSSEFIGIKTSVGDRIVIQ
jgi:alpha-L-fucosidase 2